VFNLHYIFAQRATTSLIRGFSGVIFFTVLFQPAFLPIQIQNGRKIKFTSLAPMQVATAELIHVARARQHKKSSPFFHWARTHRAAVDEWRNLI